MVQGFNLLSPLLKGAGLFCTETMAHAAAPGSRHHLRLDGYTWWDPLVGPWGAFPPLKWMEIF